MLTPRVIQYGGSADTSDMNADLVFKVLATLLEKAELHGGIDYDRDEGLITIMQGNEFLEWLSRQDSMALSREVCEELGSRAADQGRTLLASTEMAVGGFLDDAISRACVGDNEGDWGNFIDDDGELTLLFEEA